MKKILVFVKLFFCLNTLSATNYYVSTSDGDNTDNGLTEATAWATIGKVRTQMSSFNAGDNILFKRGDTFTESRITLWTSTYSILSITKSGTASNPITFGAYGSGNKPKFTGTPSNQSLQYMIYVSNQGYIVIRDWEIISPTLTDAGLTEQSIIERAVTFSVSNNCKLISCKISRVGAALLLEESDFCLMDSNEVDHNKMIVNTIGGDDDYGGNSVILDLANNNTITNNYFHDCYAESYDYGFDGGAVEFNATCTNNFIAYNNFFNGIAIAEFGSNHGPGHNINNNIFAYNLLLNNGSLFYVNNATGQSFDVDVDNLQWYNNVIVENTTGPLNEPYMFSARATPSSGMVVMKNNIIYLTTGIDFASNQWSGSQLVHTNNIYKLSGGSLIGYTAGVSESSTSATIWTNTTSGDPRNWDFHLPASSPAIDFGVVISGLTKDFAGSTLSGVREAGVYQYSTGGSSVCAGCIITQHYIK